jgi:hypothetical protein
MYIFMYIMSTGLKIFGAGIGETNPSASLPASKLRGTVETIPGKLTGVDRVASQVLNPLR